MNPCGLKTVGLVFGRKLIDPLWTSTAFYKMLLMNLQLLARTKRWQTRTYAMDDLEPVRILEEIRGDVQARELDAVIWGAFLGHGLCESTHKMNLPTVGFAQGIADHDTILSIDMNSLIHAGVDFLVKAGCGRVWVVGSPGGGVEDILLKRTAEYGLDFRMENIIGYDLESSDLFAYEMAGANSAEKLLKTCDHISLKDGVMVLDDVIACGFVNQMIEMGFHPGRNFHLISHCNKGAPTLYGLTEGMALLEIDSAEIAMKLLNRLDELMGGVTHGDVYSIRPNLILPRLKGGIHETVP
ncbi:MAG: hypothetical protein SFY92_11880 [Verrucomicrobiae bacterium]|nr:hypothetical protein [Verrucomicrobiae bacterium]